MIASIFAAYTSVRSEPTLAVAAGRLLRLVCACCLFTFDFIPGSVLASGRLA